MLAAYSIIAAVDVRATITTTVPAAVTAATATIAIGTRSSCRYCCCYYYYEV